MTTLVDRTIEIFGGLSKFAKALGHRNMTTAQGWQKKGQFPEWRIEEIRTVAAVNNKPLPRDFPPPREIKPVDDEAA